MYSEEILPNTNSNREDNTYMTEKALKTIKDPHGRKLVIFTQSHQHKISKHCLCWQSSLENTEENEGVNNEWESAIWT